MEVTMDFTRDFLVYRSKLMKRIRKEVDRIVPPDVMSTEIEAGGHILCVRRSDDEFGKYTDVYFWEDHNLDALEHVLYDLMKRPF